MKNLLFYDYGNGCADLVIENLKKTNAADTKIWIDNVGLFLHNCEKSGRTPSRKPDYNWLDLREGVINEADYDAPPELMDKMFEFFYEFALAGAREDIKTHTNLGLHKDNHKYGNSSLYAMQHIFYMLINFFVDVIKKHKIELVIFNNIPHEGADFVLYKLCKTLNIEVFILSNCVIFPSKFFYCTDMSDFANFDKLNSVSEPVVFKIKPKVEKAYKDLAGLYNKFDNSMVPSLINWLFFNEKLQIKYKSIKRLFKFRKRKNNEKWHELDMQLSNTLAYLDFLRYKQNSDNLLVNQVNFDDKYVFFPLHFQPEATTLAFAGRYSDQILALECLSKKIPDGWHIYVKDHYAQTAMMRDPIFYKRIKALKSVKLLSLEISTYKLIENAQFVATITGTAGYEAVCGGKKALVFGKAWYASLPGVFKYSHNLNIQDILDYKIETSMLEEKMSQMSSKMFDGVIDSDYWTWVSSSQDKDYVKNSLVVADSLTKIIK